MRRRICALLGLLAIGWTGCPATDDPGNGSGSYTDDLGDDPDFTDAHGLIQVQTWFEYGETQLQGSFSDGPPLRFHEESERIGNCRLMTYTPSNCDPACPAEEFCIDGECVAWPARQDHGDLLWTWPDGELTVSPDDWFGYWATGAASTAGDVSIETADLALSVSTVTAPEPTEAWDAVLSGRGSDDAVLAWSNPIDGARIRVHMTDCVGSHGGFAAAEIECEGPDTGELVLPDEFLTTLEAGDWSHGECGSHTFTRYLAASPDGDPTIRLETRGNAGLFYFPGW